jgi:hypothetical protein
VTVDSWDSDPNNDGVFDEPFDGTAGTGNKNDNGSVGSISVSTGAISTNNGDVWGYVSTAGDDPSNDVGATGSILGEDSAANGYTTVDPSRVATDFSASFDAVSTPTKTYLSIPGGRINGGGTELPLPADVAAGNKVDADGNYYYTADQINMTNGTLLITGKVVLQLTDSWAIKMAGSDKISITSSGSLDIYTAGKVTIAGLGVSNGTDANGNGTLQDSEVGAASKFQLWGTATSGTQVIDVTGNGALSGTIYAPQGNVTITGNGGISGSVVANNITLTGNAAFHYDESLADDGNGNPYRVSVWKEITSATDRAAVESVLSF